MALTEDEKAQLEALSAKAEQADEDDEFDGEPIEVWNSDGSGARLSGKHSRAWLEEKGFLKPRTPAKTDDDDGNSGAGDGGKATGKGRQSKGTPVRPSTKYFGAKK
jgi:hypothetical protein